MLSTSANCFGTAANLQNIVMILTDHQRADELVAMPSVEGLAITDVFSRSAYLTTPVCTPTRASILAGGIHGFRTQVLDNSDWVKLDDSSTIAIHLQKAGYKTGFL